jgi:hypothetical protein
LTLLRKNSPSANLGALKKRADAKRILAIQKALAGRRNGTAPVLPVRGNNVTMLRNRFLSSKNVTLKVLPTKGNDTLKFAHLPNVNATHADNATVPLVKLAPLKAVNGAVKGGPAAAKKLVGKVGNMTDAELAARRKAVLAKFAQLAQKAANNGTVKAAKKK